MPVHHSFSLMYFLMGLDKFKLPVGTAASKLYIMKKHSLVLVKRYEIVSNYQNNNTKGWWHKTYHTIIPSYSASFYFLTFILFLSCVNFMNCWPILPLIGDQRGANRLGATVTQWLLKWHHKRRMHLNCICGCSTNVFHHPGGMLVVKDVWICGLGEGGSDGVSCSTESLGRMVILSQRGGIFFSFLCEISTQKDGIGWLRCNDVWKSGASQLFSLEGEGGSLICDIQFHLWEYVDLVCRHGKWWLY